MMSHDDSNGQASWMIAYVDASTSVDEAVIVVEIRRSGQTKENNRICDWLLE